MDLRTRSYEPNRTNCISNFNFPIDNRDAWSLGDGGLVIEHPHIKRREEKAGGVLVLRLHLHHLVILRWQRLKIFVMLATQFAKQTSAPNFFIDVAQPA